MARSARPISLISNVPTIDRVLQIHAAELGRDFTAYCNHVYRVLNLCAALAGECADLEKIAVAAAFHDLGIWTNKTFDYLAPSVALAREYVSANGRAEWIVEIEAMIEEHHKITGAAAAPGSLVEPFRRADWIDVTRGWRTFGVPRERIASLFRRWPSAGFHWRLVTLAAGRFRAHPLTPLPMVRL